MRRALVSIACLAALLGATTRPATRATTRPATRPTTDRTIATYASASRGLRFRVPTAWGRSTAGVAPELADQVFSFELNGGDARRNAGAPTAVRTRIDVALSAPANGRERLEQIVEDARAGLKHAEPNATLVDDRAADVEGRPAWVLKWRVTAPSRVTRTDLKGRRTEGPGATVVFFRQKTLFVLNGSTCDVELIAEESLFERMSTVAAKVVASIEPTPPSERVP